MNIQEKIARSASHLRARALSVADTLTIAGRDLNRVARLHATRLARENRVLALDAGKDIGALARSTFIALTRPATVRVVKKKATRKRKVAKGS